MTTDDGKPADRGIILGDSGSGDNRVRPFRIEGMDVRGRAVRLGTALDAILAAHAYAPPLAALTGEMVALAALLGSMLKSDGIVTLQARGADGAPVDFLVADFATPGDLRGYAEHDAERLAALPEDASLNAMLGEGGTLAITLDQGRDSERYQGIVELTGESLAACAMEYFARSEQTPTAVRLAAGRDPVSGHWRSGGVMVQHLATGGGTARPVGEETQAELEDWRRATLLMDSVSRPELLDPALGLDALLYRLFNEDGVRVFEPLELVHRCRCSRARLMSVLRSYDRAALEDMMDDGEIQATCRFCSATYSFDADALYSHKASTYRNDGTPPS